MAVQRREAGVVKLRERFDPRKHMRACAHVPKSVVEPGHSDDKNVNNAIHTCVDECE